MLEALLKHKGNIKFSRSLGVAERLVYGHHIDWWQQVRSLQLLAGAKILGIWNWCHYDLGFQSLTHGSLFFFFLLCVCVCGEMTHGSLYVRVFVNVFFWESSFLFLGLANITLVKLPHTNVVQVRITTSPNFIRSLISFLMKYLNFYVINGKNGFPLNICWWIAKN